LEGRGMGAYLKRMGLEKKRSWARRREHEKGGG